MNEFAPAVNFYRHSGKAPLLGLILIGIAGLIATPILGLLYGYLLFYIPFMYLNFLIVLGYPFAVGFVLSKAAEFGKVRNNILLGLAGFGFGLLAEYIGWVSWIAALAKDFSYLWVFLYPSDVIGIIMTIAKEGVWSISNATPTGVMLYLVWAVEAIIVVGGTTYITFSSLSDVPFCEESDAWARKKSVLGVFAPLANPAQFKASIVQGSVSIFNELKPVQAGNKFTLLELYECDICRNFFVLNIKEITITINRKGQQEQKEKPIVSNLLANSMLLASIRRLNQQQEPSPSS